MTRKTLIELITAHPDNTIKNSVINRWRAEGLEMYWSDLKNFANDTDERKQNMQESWKHNGDLLFSYGLKTA